MKNIDALLIKIENTKDFNFVVVSHDQSAASLLLPERHDRLRRFENITLVRDVPDLLKIYASNKNKKLVVFVDVTSRYILPELKEMIYSVHAEGRGLLFAFTFGKFTDGDFEHLISVGFDELFELESDDERRYLRMYSWIRRFGGSPISDEDAEKNAIVYLSNKKNKRIGQWTILGSEMVARDESGQRIKLTRQEIEFLTLLFEESNLVEGASYNKLFRAPHAIVHKLKKKLGSNLPIQHDSGGRYRLLRDEFTEL